MIRRIFSSMFFLTAAQTQASIHLGPYIQNVSDRGAWIVWEDSLAVESQVRWGRSPDSLNQVTASKVLARHPRNPERTYVHKAPILGLEPATPYFYQIVTSGGSSSVFRFVTAPARDVSTKFNFAVYGDTQNYAHVHKNVVEHGLKRAALASDPSGRVEDHLAFVLVPGDLVHDGSSYQQYKRQFFDPIAAISSGVPYYPAIGNHEYQGLDNGEDPIFLNYFHSPTNGSERFDGQWYSIKHGNAHVISINTSIGSTAEFRYHPVMHNPQASVEQMEWFEREIETACTDVNTDFVFAFFHYPNKSELWVPGGDNYSARLVASMEEKLGACGKAGAVYNGHTHAYERGQSKEVPLYWVTVGTGGGSLDLWGEYENRDYENIQKAFPTFGFVFVEVESGPDAKFTIKLYSQGDDLNNLKPNTLMDVYSYRKTNSAPTLPVGERSVAQADGWLLKGSAFVDSENDGHLESQWQVFNRVDGEETVVYDKWVRYENWYNNVDTQAGADITELFAPSVRLPSGNPMYWRIRYRDDALRWSPWSQPSPLQP